MVTYLSADDPPIEWLPSAMERVQFPSIAMPNNYT